MMTKKDFIVFADKLSTIEKHEREIIINFLIPILKSNNPKFNEIRFKTWIYKKIGLYLLGLDSKIMYWGLTKWQSKE